MPYILIEDFRYGQDTRKLSVTSPPGTLRQAKNAHITRGGEIEKAKKFVEKYTLPSSTTHGLASADGVLYVFGSTASPGSIPAGVTYQQLAHPDASSAMSDILYTEVFGTKVYVVAEFANGDIFHYYDGSLVVDWGAGIVRSGMTNNDGIAAHLESLITSDDYSTGVAANVITITAANAGTPFTISSTAENVTGGTDDQTAAVATTTPSVAGVSETLSTASFSVTGGSANTAATGTVELTGGASGSVDGITVNGVQIMSGAESFDTSLDTTATNVAANITAHTSSPNYTATAAGSVITISATTAAGADPNTFAVVSSATTITTSDTNMAGGVTNAVTSITVDGIEVLGSRVNWSSSNSTLAANIAAQIDSYTSSPEYTADSATATVTISGDTGSGDTPNGKTVSISVAGDVTVSPTSTAMAGGVDAVSGQAQVSTVTIGGTFEAGDKFTITLDDYPYGITSRPSVKGTSLLTFKKKMYSGAGPNLHFSSINAPTLFSSEEVGAGFIDMSAEAQGSEEIVGLGSYYNNLAIFCNEAIQVWSMDADPTNNAQAQVIPNVRTISGRSIKGIGEGDVMFLTRSGVRALKARDSSNFASVSEIGTSIDDEVKTLISGLTEDQKSQIVANVDPLDNRYLLAITSKIYVFSFFSGSKVSAWSVYSAGISITAFANIEDNMYARAGDKIYLYGGDDGDTYVDAGECVITLPFLDGKNPAQQKTLESIDVSLQGSWKIELAFDPEQPTNYEEVARVNQSSWALLKIGVAGETTHISARFTSLDGNYGKIGNLAIHYAGGETS